MPCTYTGSIQGDDALGAEESLDYMTDLLCQLCHVVEDEGGSMPKPVTTWYERHKKDDLKKCQIPYQREFSGLTYACGHKFPCPHHPPGDTLET